MAAGVLSRTISRGLDMWGHIAVSFFSYTGPNPYATGGESHPAVDFKLGVVEQVDTILAVNVATTGLVLFVYNHATEKIQAFWQTNVATSQLIEVTNGTDLSGFSGRGIAYGKG